MGLDTVFQKAATTAFGVFQDMVVSSTYIEIVDDGFDSRTETEYSCPVIPAQYTEKEKNALSFAQLIQPTDVIGLVTGESMSVVIVAKNQIQMGTELFTIVAKEIDPAGALYILLLRHA